MLNLASRAALSKISSALIFCWATLFAGNVTAQGPEAIIAGDSRTARELVLAHNQERGRLGIAPLTWSDDLATTAQSWAETLIRRGEFAHSGRYGENLYEITGGASAPSRVVGAWAEEARNYDPEANHCISGMCGHYTQVVWSDTRKVGCGVARDTSRQREVWVCNYDPYGNIIGERPFDPTRLSASAARPAGKNSVRSGL